MKLGGCGKLWQVVPHLLRQTSIAVGIMYSVCCLLNAVCIRRRGDLAVISCPPLVLASIAHTYQRQNWISAREGVGGCGGRWKGRRCICVGACAFEVLLCISSRSCIARNVLFTCFSLFNVSPLQQLPEAHY